MTTDKDMEEAHRIRCQIDRLNREDADNLLASEIARIRSEAKVETLREAAESAGKWLAENVPRNYIPTALQERDELRSAILTDEPNNNGKHDFCGWAFDGNLWTSDCGLTWEFPELGPKDNGVAHCHGCGKPARLADEPNKEE